MAATKAQKILKRTLVGGSLVSVLALLLWWTSQSGDGAPIFWAAAIILLGAVFETTRMGSLAPLGFGPSLVLASLGVLALANASAEARSLVQENHAFQPAPGDVFQPGLLVFAGFATVIALASYGLMHVFERLTKSWLVAQVLVYLSVGAAILFALHDLLAVHAHFWAACGVLLAIAVVTLPFVARGPRGVQRFLAAGGLALWLVPPLPALWDHWASFGTQGLVALLVLSKIGDTCGYYVGSAIGRSHPFPRISPGKTTAGCVGSFLGATAVGGVLYATHVLPDSRFGLPGALAGAALVNLAAQAGDLFESWVKRRAGVKDSSSVFGPSGGLLDQIDSLLFTVPMATLTWPWLFAITR
jgi:phosphatidate cytidylyltransferase